MNSEALGALYERYARELFLYLYALCGNASLAEDLLHDVFVKALLSLPDSHPNLRAWLYLVARNACFSRLRRENRTLPAEGIDPPDPGLAPPDEAVAAERARRLHTAIYALPARERQVIVLQYFSGLSQAHIAEVMGLSGGNVRVIAHRAKKRLLQALKED